MFARKSSISLLFTLLFSSVAYAQQGIPDPGTYQVYRLPEGWIWSADDLGSDDPTDYSAQCYNLDEFKLLLKMDNDLRLADEEVVSLITERDALQFSVEHFQLALTASDAEIAIIKKEKDRIYDKWKSENLARHKAENRPAFGSWIPWALSGVLAVTSTVLLISVVGN